MCVPRRCYKRPYFISNSMQVWTSGVELLDILPRKYALVYIVMFLLMMKYGLVTTLSPATAHLRDMARLPASDSPSKEMSSGTSSKMRNSGL